ncbi:MAG: hypothetical protein JSS04_10280, partial [Proteobacteria bacterium]|nr:hypothetical protein [Pseudomonadota bacterium]
MMDLQVMMPQAYTPMPRLSTDASGWAASESRLGAGMGDLSNLDRNGRIISADDRQWFFKLGDRALDDRTKAEAEDLICWT